MRDLKLYGDGEGEGDLQLVDGDLAFVDDAAEILQSIGIRLRFFAGEWFLDNRLGVPYYETVLVKLPDLAVIESVMRSAILNTVGMGSITSYSQTLDRTARTLTIVWRGVTADGNAIANTEGISL